MRDFKYVKNVVTLKINKEKCNGCGMCINVCPHDVFKIINKKAEIIFKDLCMECGACALNCTQKAITVKSGLGCGCATGIIYNFFKTNNSCCECS